MYRVGIVTQSGEVMAKNFETKEEVDDFILSHNAKNFRIMDKIS